MKNQEPAFPTRIPSDQNLLAGYTILGMTIRDYFAAKAMQGDLANPEAGCLSLDALADECVTRARAYYCVADAMLTVREEEEEKEEKEEKEEEDL
jgi:hypothetical protein